MTNKIFSRLLCAHLLKKSDNFIICVQFPAKTNNLLQMLRLSTSTHFAESFGEILLLLLLNSLFNMRPLQSTVPI